MRERFVSGLAAGLLIFFLGMFLGGLLGLYSTAFFVALPLAMCLAAGRRFYRFAMRCVRHSLAVRRRSTPSLVTTAVALFGLAGVAMVYFPILNPGNMAADSHWYHLPIAEHYVAQGGIKSFPEGWYQGTLPHLSSLVYAWAFLLPAADAFEHIELAAHLEFVIFLWTLAAVPVLTAWAVAPALRNSGNPRSPAGSRTPRHAAGAWAAMFLFPGIFLYDSSLGIASDHIAAFWAIPVLIALVRASRAPTVASAVALSIPTAGALLTKYQCLAIVAFPIAAFMGSLLWRSVHIGRQSDSRPTLLLAVLAFSASELLLTAPHWLKNWVWYGDPVYPFLHRYLHVHPWTIDSANLFEDTFKSQLWRPEGAPWKKLKDTLEVLVSFSFKPHDWDGFHGKVPVFGSLFTLFLVPLLFVARAARVWVVVAASEVGVLVWFWTSHQDRYLQGLVPWMVVGAASAIRLMWATGAFARVTASALIAFQIIWGGDVPFIPTHAMLGTAPAKVAIDLLSSGYRKDFKSRSNVFGDFGLVAKQLPKGAKVLIHDRHDHLGIAAMSISDIGPWQGGISYGRMGSARAFYDRMREYGVTHILWQGESSGYDSLAGDLVFSAFLVRYEKGERKIGGHRLGAMPRQAPPDDEWTKATALVLSCNEYALGLYQLEDLTVPSAGSRHYPVPRAPFSPEAMASLVDRSDFVVLDQRCHPDASPPEGALFRKKVVRKGADLWVRVAPKGSPLSVE